MSSLADEKERSAHVEAKRWAFLFAGVTALLCAGMAVLLRENSRLRDQLAALAAAKARAGGLDLGSAVAPIRLTEASGASVTVRFEDEGVGTLLLFYSAGCEACASTSERWREALAAADRPDLRVLCVQTDGAEVTRLDLDGLPASLSVPLPPAGWLAALPAVPATLLIDDRGELSWAEYGELGADSTRDLTRAISAVGMHASSDTSAASPSGTTRR